MITKDKVTEIFCIIDEFDKNLSAEYSKNQRLPSHNSDGNATKTARACSVKVSNSFMDSRLRWRINWWLCGTKSCWGKETLSSVLTNYSRTKPTLFTQDTARYTTLSWTCVLPLQHTSSLRTSQRHCWCMWKNQGSWNLFMLNLSWTQV